ncbi:MAG TPA: hypothetical protein VFN67_27170 [Polyangiales bacterium]|nr:hypothetical protein [Polyangiales bacterium]
MRRSWIEVLSVFGVICGLLACDSLSPRSANPSLGGGDLDPCAETTQTTLLDWDESSELGTPQEAFEKVEGQCAGSLRWNGKTDLADVAADGDIVMSVDVELDHESARLITHGRSHRGPPLRCPSELEVDAKVSLRSDDGRIDVQANTKARFREGVASSLVFTLPKSEQRGSLSLRERKGETIALNFELDGASENCAGEIMVTTTSTGADGTGRGAAGRIGAWSASGCPTSQEPFELEREVAGSTLPELIETAWDGRTFEGTWSDGSTATLSLQVELIAGAAVCGEHRNGDFIVTLPVEARYSTDDGRLEQRAAAANVRAELRDGELDQLSLWISDELTCETTGSQLAYTQADCTQLKAATVQLGLNNSGGEDSVPSDGGLNVYFLPRFGELPAPDRLSLH